MGSTGRRKAPGRQSRANPVAAPVNPNVIRRARIVDDFDDRLKEATAGINSEYFQLPIAGGDSPIYRERCYCYELYHQLRLCWPDCSYKLSGEVDKAGHPVIRGNDLDRSKPDLLIHIPEDMDHNFAVIEVKPITGAIRGIKKDVRRLLAFLDRGGYEQAHYLVYGSEWHGTALETASNQIARNGDARIKLWHHAYPNQSAEPVAIRAIRV